MNVLDEIEKGLIRKAKLDWYWKAAIQSAAARIEREEIEPPINPDVELWHKFWPDKWD